MPDATTLFFSAKGHNSIGGFDIYTTRLDVDNGGFIFQITMDCHITLQQTIISWQLMKETI